MRITSTGIAAWFSLMIAASTVNGQPQSKPEIILDYTTPPRLSLSLDDQKEIAGLSRKSKAELLNWQTAYTLALVRARGGRGAVLHALDRGFLAASADRLGVVDFGRFRIEFRALRSVPRSRTSDVRGAGTPAKDRERSISTIPARVPREIGSRTTSRTGTRLGSPGKRHRSRCVSQVSPGAGSPHQRIP